MRATTLTLSASAFGAPLTIWVLQQGQGQIKPRTRYGKAHIRQQIEHTHTGKQTQTVQIMLGLNVL